MSSDIGGKISEQGRDYTMKEPFKEKEMPKSYDDIFHPSMQTSGLTYFL